MLKVSCHLCLDVSLNVSFDVSFKVSFDVFFKVSFDVSFHVSFDVSFDVSFIESCSVSFNVSFRVSFNVSFPVSFRVSFNVSFHVSFDLHEVHTVFLRAMPRFQGVVAHDCVKVWIELENVDGGPTQRSPYFGKCIAFLQDSDGKQFVVLQWFHRHEDNGFDTISRVPSFKLGPEAHTKSYSTLPLHTILNGALMVPGGGRYWAVLSPREHKTYARFFQ
jgi:hypothetical protein